MTEISKPKVLLAEDCPCNEECSLHGNCVQCVAAHRRTDNCLPVCLSDIARRMAEA